MLTLITGAPGTGKTAALVKLLDELSKDRTIFVNGIPELKINHVELVDPANWMNEVPDGAAVVIDEVQTVWRPRGPGSKVPDHIAALETHRHRGLDFFIITQGPNLVDSNVRALVGRHIHLRDLGVLGRYWYEWPECADNCRTGWRNAPIKKKYRLPKAIFDKYKSASIHIKPIRSFPVVLVVLLAALIGAGFLVWRSYQAITARMAPAEVPSEDSAPVDRGRADDLVPAPVRTPAVMAQSAPDERVDFIPRLSDRPWTAPAYDHLRQVQHVPYIAGGLCVDDDCRCFAEDGGRLDVSSDACLDWINSRSFTPYRARVSASGKDGGYRSSLSNSSAAGAVAKADASRASALAGAGAGAQGVLQ